MDVPSFSRFRSGSPAPLSSGGTVTYDELKKSGLQEHYLRIIHKLISKGEVDKKQLDGWLKRAKSGDRAEGQKVRLELEATQPKPEVAATPSPFKRTPQASGGAQRSAQGTATRTRGRKGSRSEKLLTLISKGNHKEAVKTAQGYHLSPVQVAASALRPGQSAEAHTVQAPTSVASKLITTGYWATQ